MKKHTIARKNCGESKGQKMPQGGDAYRFSKASDLFFTFMALKNQNKERYAKQASEQSEVEKRFLKDVLNSLDTSYRSRRLIIDHLRVLNHYGRRQRVPRLYLPNEARAATLWAEALDILKPIWQRLGYLKDDLASQWVAEMIKYSAEPSAIHADDEHPAFLEGEGSTKTVKPEISGDFLFHHTKKPQTGEASWFS